MFKEAKEAADKLLKIEGTEAYRVPMTPNMQGMPYNHTPVLSNQQIQSAIERCPNALIDSIGASSRAEGAVIDRGIQDVLRSHGEDTRGGGRSYNNSIIHNYVNDESDIFKNASASSTKPRP